MRNAFTSLIEHVDVANFQLSSHNILLR